MNKAKLSQQKNLSPFFFEKKIYQYTSKSLSDSDRLLMKSYTEKDTRAKKVLASVLMSLEYLEELKETNIQDDWVRQQVSSEEKKEAIIKYSIICLLVLSLLVMSFLAYKTI